MTTALPLNLDTLHLDAGSHASFDEGHCLMEAAAFFAAEVTK